ncbi:hypothetical protein SAMD00019534_013570 [Acytostelium subglobosum LB1]|uniref:hypothetical protein n=1 Tax=Acytostelium subglobosum LB1 TaxID=1410327 RepID=UPI0006451445|nr:hypothetical protein SAMD00019534_013570 [Acytostelium subglobosum LB1]GAM18182.1 hypothetical protein SAMD00019534_013570 [Acytostelium subglobosum LB1]|eukprot:XP_012758778.1 hypothetical protein SAMD00019534_013570 [Acytostelium subglobosum LB1]
MNDPAPFSGIPNQNMFMATNVNVSLGVPTEIGNRNYNAQFLSGGCRLTEWIPLTNTYFPVSYSTIPALPTCSAPNSTLKVDFGNDMSKFKMFKDDSVQVIVDANNSTNVTYGSNYSMQSECFTKSLYAVYSTVKPVYYVYTTDPTCVGIIHMYVQNYDQFSSIKMVDTFNTSNVFYADANGEFNGLYYAGSWQLATVDKCGKTFTQQVQILESSTSLDTNFLTFEITNLNEPMTCTSIGNMSILPIYKGLRGSKATFTNFSNSNSYLSIPFHYPTCTRYTPTVYYSYAGAYNFSTLTLLRNASCTQSTDGLVRLDIIGNYTLALVTINGGFYSPAANYSLGPGKYNFQLQYTGMYFCYQYLTIEVFNNNPSYEIKYTTSPQSTTDCSVKSGKFYLQEDESNFNSVILNGIKSDSGQGVWTTGSFKQGTLVFNHTVCGVGIINYINLTTVWNGVTIQVDTATPPMCDRFSSGGDGIAPISLTVFDNSLPITQLSSDNSSLTLSNGLKSIGSVGSGRHWIWVKSTYCLWNKKIEVKGDYSPSYAATVSKYPDPGMSNGVINIVPLKVSSAMINSVSTTSGNVGPDKTTVVGWNEYNIIKLTIQDYTGCRTLLSVNTTPPASQSPKPFYTTTSAKRCGPPATIVTFDAYSLANFEINVNNVAPDNTGSITLFNDNYRYRHRQLTSTVIYESTLILSEPMVLPISPLKYTVSNETCTNSFDGSVTVTGADWANYQYTLLTKSNGYLSAANVDQFGGTVTFVQLSAQTYTLYVYSRNNTYCLQTVDILVALSEPKIDILTPMICDMAKGGSITINVSPPTAIGTVTFGEQTMTAPLQQNVMTNVSAGLYVVTATLTHANGQCPRKYTKYVSVVKKPYFLRAYAPECGAVIFDTNATLNVATIQLWTDTDQVVVPQFARAFTQTSVFDQLETGRYKVVVLENSGCMLQTDVISVTKCVAPTTSTTTGWTSWQTSATTSDFTTTTTGGVTTGSASTSSHVTGGVISTTTGLNHGAISSPLTQLHFMIVTITIIILFALSS